MKPTKPVAAPDGPTARPARGRGRPRIEYQDRMWEEAAIQMIYPAVRDEIASQREADRADGKVASGAQLKPSELAYEIVAEEMHMSASKVRRIVLRIEQRAAKKGNR